MRKILVIGANGKVGRILTQKLNDSPKFVPTAGVRKEEQKAFFEEMGVGGLLIDLEGTVDELADKIKGIDAIVFSAGSGSKTGDDMTLAIDLDGAVKAMQAVEKVGVKRFVMISAIHADTRSEWKTSGINGYYIAKHYADWILQRSTLDYTILRPGRLLDEAGRGKLTTENPESQKGVTREDVADLILEVLEHDNSIGKIITFNEGDTTIKEVVRRS